MPRPTPITAMQHPPSTHVGVVTVSCDRSTSPIAISTEPAIGIALYRPVLVTTRPASVEVRNNEPIIGSISRPATVALTPVTIWR